MQDVPSYNDYTLAELYDARTHIDEDRYPERVEEIERLIRENQDDLSVRQDFVSDESFLAGVSRRGIGVYLFLSGAISVATTANHVLTIRDSSVWWYGIPVLIYGGMTIGGVLLMKRVRSGLWISTVCVALQIPAFQVGRVAYTAMAFPSLEAKLWPELGFAVSLSSTFHFSWHSTSQPLYLGMNIWAGVAVGLLIDQVSRLQAARTRLSHLSSRKAS